jgi:hypothetical protein
LLIADDLTGRIDGNGLIALLDVHGVEQPDLVETHNVPEISTHQHVHVGNRGEGDVQHVVAEPRSLSDLG